jgi:hypothetical protein
MAYNYYSGPSAGAAFVQGFMGTFGPMLKARMASDAKTKEGFIAKWGDEYTLAKQAMQKNSAENAEYMRLGKEIVGGIDSSLIPSGVTEDQLSAYAGMLTQSKKGDWHAARSVLAEELSQGIITGMADVTRQISSTIQGTHVPPISTTNAESDDLFTTNLSASESSNNPTASNTTGDGREFGGLFQFGEMRLADYNAANGTNVTVDGLKDGSISAEQQKAIQKWSVSDIDSYIDSENLKNYEGTTINGVKITKDSMRAVAHLGGKEGMKKFLTTQGEYNPTDNPQNPEQGTTLLDYARKFSVGPEPTSNAVQAAEESDIKKTKLNSTYNLPSLDGTEETESLGFFEKAGRNLKQVFSSDNTESLMQDALVEFKDQLASAGELENYELIQKGQIDLTPRSFGLDGIGYNYDATQFGDFPLASTITSVAEFEGLEADWDAGKFQKTEQNTSAYERMKARYNELPDGLPRNVIELTSEQSIRNAKALYDGLSDEQKENLPEGYGNRLKSVFGTLEGGGGINDIYQQLRDRSLVAAESDNPDEAQAALDLFVQQDLVFRLEQSNATETKMDSVERITTLLDIKGMVERMDYTPENSETTRYAKTLAGIDNSIETIRTAIKLADKDSSGGGVGGSSGLGRTSNQAEFVIQERDASGQPTGKLTHIDAYYDEEVDGKPVWRNKKTFEKITPEIVARFEDMPKDWIKQRMDILTKLDNRGVSDYQKLGIQLGEYYTITAEMAQLVDESARINVANGAPNANLLNSRITGKVAAGLDTVIQTTASALGQFNAIRGKAVADPDGLVDLEGSTAMFSALEAQIARGEKDPITTVATAYHLFEAKKVLLTYKMGIMEGQSGTAMSNKDFERLMDSLGVKTAEGFKKQVTEYGSGKYNILKNTYEGVLNDSMVKAWEQSNNIPFWTGSVMEETGIRSPEDWYESLTDTGKTGFDYFTKDDSNVTQAPVTPQAGPTEPPQSNWVVGEDGIRRKAKR